MAVELSVETEADLRSRLAVAEKTINRERAARDWYLSLTTLMGGIVIGAGAMLASFGDRTLGVGLCVFSMIVIVACAALNPGSGCDERPAVPSSKRARTAFGSSSLDVGNSAGI